MSATSSLVSRFGTRLRALRTAGGLSLEQLAKRSGLTKSYISKLERGLSEPSISSVQRLAEALSIGVAELLGETVSEDGLRVIRGNPQRPRAAIGTAELIHGSVDARQTGLSAYLLHPAFPDEGHPRSEISHFGEEFIHVLTGRVELRVADHIETLEPGDSAWYRAEFDHRIHSVGTTQATVLIVTCHGH